MYTAKIANNISIHGISLCMTEKHQNSSGLDEHMIFFDEDFESRKDPSVSKH